MQFFLANFPKIVRTVGFIVYFSVVFPIRLYIFSNNCKSIGKEHKIMAEVLDSLLDLLGETPVLRLSRLSAACGR